MGVAMIRALPEDSEVSAESSQAPFVGRDGSYQQELADLQSSSTLAKGLKPYTFPLGMTCGVVRAEKDFIESPESRNYTQAKMDHLAKETGRQMTYIGDWNHPQGQKPLRFDIR